MLFQTTWKRLACCALVLGSISSCSDPDTDSKQSPNTATDNGNSGGASEAGAAASVAEVSANVTSSRSQPSAAATADADGGESTRITPLRIVPFGDSITAITCTSQLLWQSLHKTGVKNFDMIGTSRNAQDCGVRDADRDNEGHGGYRATDMVDDGPHAAELSAWCDADKGDVVLLHLGTNDIAHGQVPPATILSAFSKILAKLRAVQPKVVVFVAQIIPMVLSDCPECTGLVPKFNEQIPAWAARESRDDSPVYVVDQFSGFDPAADTDDGVHPNKQGSTKMADKWAAALHEHLQQL